MTGILREKTLQVTVLSALSRNIESALRRQSHRCLYNATNGAVNRDYLRVSRRGLCWL